MNKVITACAVILALVTSAAASILTIRIWQDEADTRWSINNRNVSMVELEGLLLKLASIDTNQFLYIVPETNVPSTILVQTLGVVQRAGLHNLGLICSGIDGTNAGTWQITLDARINHLPTCIANEHSLSGFQRENIADLEILPKMKKVEDGQHVPPVGRGEAPRPLRLVVSLK